jgi:hypothetical protein
MVSAAIAVPPVVVPTATVVLAVAIIVVMVIIVIVEVVIVVEPAWSKAPDRATASDDDAAAATVIASAVVPSPTVIARNVGMIVPPRVVRRAKHRVRIDVHGIDSDSRSERHRTCRRVISFRRRFRGRRILLRFPLRVIAAHGLKMCACRTPPLDRFRWEFGLTHTDGGSFVDPNLVADEDPFFRLACSRHGQPRLTLR